MSASKEKKNRLDQRTDGPDKKSVAAAEQAKKDRAFRRNAIIAVVVIVVLVAAALVINSDLFYTRTTAVQVGDTQYSPAEVNYFFKTSFNQIYNQYYSAFGSSITSLVDASKPLDTQMISEEQSWADMVFEQAKTDMRQVTVYYDAAIKAGYTLNDEDRASVETAKAQMQTYATANSFSSLSKYLAAYFGKGMDEELFTRLSEKVALASRYSQDLLESLEYTDEELETYYQAHAEELDYYDFYLYSVSTTNEKFSELEDDEAKKTAAHEAAEKIADAEDAAAFLENIGSFTGEEVTSYNITHLNPSSLGESYKEWVMDPSRKAGDTTVADTDTVSYALMYVGHDDNDYKTVSMRHILINAEADENGEYTDEAKAAAEAKIQEIRTEWEADKTEDNFAALAEQYSDDGGSNTNGGLYENIPKNQMVPVVNDFLFAEGRKAGDTDVVFNEGSYVGCHLLYFVGEGETTYRLQLAKNAKSSEDFNAKYEELSANYEVVEGSGLRFATLA